MQAFQILSYDFTFCTFKILHFASYVGCKLSNKIDFLKFFIQQELQIYILRLQNKFKQIRLSVAKRASCVLAGYDAVTTN